MCWEKAATRSLTRLRWRLCCCFCLSVARKLESARFCGIVCLIVCLIRLRQHQLALYLASVLYLALIHWRQLALYIALLYRSHLVCLIRWRQRHVAMYLASVLYLAHIFSLWWIWNVSSTSCPNCGLVFAERRRCTDASFLKLAWLHNGDAALPDVQMTVKLLTWGASTVQQWT